MISNLEPSPAQIWLIAHYLRSDNYGLAWFIASLPPTAFVDADAMMRAAWVQGFLSVQE